MNTKNEYLLDEKYEIIFNILNRSEARIRIYKDDTRLFLELCSKIIEKFKYKIENGFLYLYPCVVLGGKHTFECQKTPISDFILPILILLTFSRSNTKIRFIGITNDKNSDSCEAVKAIHIKILKIFGIKSELTIIKKGFAPSGQGIVELSIESIVEIKPIEYVRHGLKEIKGLATTAKVNSSYVNRMINYCKDLLISQSENSEDNQAALTKNVQITCDILSKEECGPTPGYHLLLYTDEKNFYYGEECCNLSSSEQNDKDQVGFKKIDELVAKATYNFLKSIVHSGSFDYKAHKLIFSLLCFSPKDVSSFEINEISQEDINFLKFLHSKYNFIYRIEREKDRNLFISFGTGYKNSFKPIL